MRDLGLAIAATALCGVSSAALAQEGGSPPGERCLPVELTQGADFVLLGMYGGYGTPAPFRIGGQGRANAVAVAGDPGRPVVLLLAAYEPTVWDLSQVPPDRVRAVYASGFNPQAVTGLPPGVPVVFRQQVREGPDRGSSTEGPCPNLRWPYGTKSATAALGRIRLAFGGARLRFFGSYAPFSFHIDGGPLPTMPRIPIMGEARAGVPLYAIAAFEPSVWQYYDRQARLPRDRVPELAGRRLFQIIWRPNGDMAGLETESFGGDSFRRQISSGSDDPTEKSSNEPR